MGLYQIWKQDVDPTDTVNPYTPYTFPDKLPTYDLGITRREAVTLIPGLDGVVSGYGRRSGPFDRRTLTVGFRVLTKRGPFAAHDLLMAAIMGEENVRLVQKTETGYLRFTTASLLSTSEPHTNDENYYFDFKVTWRIRPDWRPRFSEAEPPHYAALNNETYSASDNEVYSSNGVTNITADPTPFTMDATGTAGTDLPTLDDTGPIIYITGPAGGDGGMGVSNYSAMVLDSAGFLQPTNFTMPFNLPTANDSVYLDFGAQAFFHNGVPFRPTKPLDTNHLSYQPWYFIAKAGVVNNCTFGALASAITGLTNALLGGQITRNFWRKFA